MSTIKQISVRNENTWVDYDIGANADKVSLASTIAGETDVQGALTNLADYNFASTQSANKIVVTSSEGKLIASDVNSQVLSSIGSIDEINNLKKDICPVGVIKMYVGEDQSQLRQKGWRLCDGQPLSKTAFSELYAIIGDKYTKPGTSSDSFNLPDFRGRAPIGAGTGIDPDTETELTTRNLGDKTGKENHNHGGKTGSVTLEANQSGLPSHAHSFTNPTYEYKTSKRFAEGLAQYGFSNSTKSVNGTRPDTGTATINSIPKNKGGVVQAVSAQKASKGHDHTISSNSLMQPSLVVNFIIYTGVKTS